MKKNKTEELRVSIPELGPKFKEWREASNISVERAAEFCDTDIESIQTLENGGLSRAGLLMTYHSFFFENIPNAGELYNNFSDELLARHGYTYDEEGNEYYTKPSED